MSSEFLHESGFDLLIIIYPPIIIQFNSRLFTYKLNSPNNNNNTLHGKWHLLVEMKARIREINSTAFRVYFIVV
jgi:hypothetical protein